MSHIEADVYRELADVRSTSGCYCADYRKPCQYHDGMRDGAELALRVVMDSARADVSDWLAGA